MATGEPSSQSKGHSPQPISPGYALEVVIVDDEIPGQSGQWEVPSLLPWGCVQKRKRDWSSVSEDKVQEDPLEVSDGVAGVAAPNIMHQRPDWKKQRDSSCSELEAEAEQKEDIRLLPRKRWREYLSLFIDEPQEPSQQLSPAPSTHMGVTEKLCGLKKKRKMKHLSSVLPEHHAAFTRLLGCLSLTVIFSPHQYLLDIVITYFSRAGLFPWQYQRVHFFLSLYLANDMEEDSKLQKLDMLFFLYGRNLAQIPKFQKLHYEFICCMGWNLRVTQEECEEVGGALEMAGKVGQD
ncbi:Speedy protein E4 [Fukomys damarensis]|uniref:Speedy protein E4 n=1 Tax=Fukomys damarensis TaxID=885580 RepID=A0A091D8R0_FUKDA|nr:Speedy protein E4 [Fukomys damarensis]